MWKKQEEKEVKEYGKRHLLEFIWTGLTAVLSSAVIVGISLVLQEAIDAAIAGDVEKAVWLSVGFVVIFAVVYWLQASALVKLNQKVVGEIRGDIVKKILCKNTMEFKEYKETDYISLLQNDVKKIEDTYLDTLFSIITAAVQLLLAIVVMTHYSWVFTVVMLGMTILMFLVPAVFSKKLSKATEEVSEAQQTLTEGVSEVVYGYEVIKSFQKEEHRISGFEQCNRLMQRTAKKLELWKQANGGVSNVLAFSMQMVICVLAGWFICQGKMSYGSMVGVIQVSGSITNPLFQLFSWIPVIKSFEPIWEKITSYTKCNEKHISKGNDNPIAWDEILLRNVNFTYPNEEKQALTDINLKIKRGKKYLIVGESGGGKSTLINILCGNFIPQSGDILVDGEQLEASESFLKKLSAVVWQNIFLFNESIAENILMGDSENERLNKVIARANVEDMVTEKGMDFVVGSNGDQLSGGQKQRIAIARALYAQKDILVLDEGISALDPETAKEIETNILSEEDMTVISISHHVSTELVKMYDEVWEVKNGEVLYGKKRLMYHEL